MTSERREEVTRLLSDPSAGDALSTLVYDELKGLARQRMASERGSHTLQATALVHEAYLRLVGHEANWRDRAHFYAAASEAMRRILIDHARRVNSAKRGSGAAGREKLTLGAAAEAIEIDVDRALELEAALEKLEAEDQEAAEVTKMRFFAGLSVAETAQALGRSERSVHRKWVYARARLFELLDGAIGDGA